MRSRKPFLRKAAAKLLKECGITQPPVDLKLIASACGLEYEEIDYFPDDVDALIIAIDGRTVAAVNVNHSETRRRFSLAHELCHHLHHQDRSILEEAISIDTPPVEQDQPGKDPFEAEADFFAGELLVPTSMLKQHYRPGHTADDIGRIFNVSPHVAAIAIANHFQALFKRVL